MGKESEIITDIIEPKTKPQTSYKDVKIDPTIPLKYKRNIERVLKKIISNSFRTTCGNQKLFNTMSKLYWKLPKKVKQHPIPVRQRDKVKSEIKELEYLKITERSNSTYFSDNNN